MYQALTFYHNFTRWFVLASLLIAIYRAYRGYSLKATFNRTDNALRHWTATIAHIQLMIGMLLYVQSPAIKYFFANFKTAINNMDLVFLGLIHSLMMLSSIVLVTVGAAIAKRKQADRDKFRTMLVWYSIALILIFIAIPWPFSPIAQRPYYR